MKDTKTLKREVFETSRVLEYFTEKELRAQIGHDKNFWPIAILRELIDNSLDACETKGIAPIIDIEIKDDFIIVSDNGPGIPAEIIKKSLNYLSRVSDKAYYISPTRGQMGNALKVIYAAPFVSAGEGFVEIAARGKMHHISITVDRIAGRPVISDEVCAFVKNGTFVKIYYPDSASLLLTPKSDSYNIPPRPQDLIEGYSAFNPHATFIINGTEYKATDTAWKKWTPDMPTSIHWYNIETLSDLVAGYLVKERTNGQHKKTVREFVSEFRGLAATAKQKKITENYSRAYLTDFEKNKDIDRESLKVLLEKMQAECIAPKPDILGIIGKDHFSKWITSHGGAEHTIKYIKKANIDADGFPYVLEVGFAVNEDSTTSRLLIAGLNWSPVIGEVPDLTLRTAIQQARLDPHDPVLCLLHIARPRFEFMDRGKTKIEL